MTFRRLFKRNLAFHWRGNLAVLLGVVVGTEVLTGALFVGDSLRGSLRDLALEQLGWVDRALLANRFFRAELAEELGASRASPLLMLQGALSAPKPDELARHAGHVVVLGVDERFSPEGHMPIGEAFWAGKEDKSEDGSGELVLSQLLATELQAGVGDQVTINLQKPSAVPRESLLGRRDASSVVGTYTTRVRAILPEDAPAARFNLNPSPAPARNAWLPLSVLQRVLDQKDRANIVLIGNDANVATADLQESLRRSLRLEDWGLVLHDPESRTKDLFAKLDRNNDGQLRLTEYRGRLAGIVIEEMDANRDGGLTREEVKAYYDRRGYFALESKQLLLEPAVVEAATAAAASVNPDRSQSLASSPTMVYLANWITEAKKQIPYSIVAALDPKLPAPLGPFLPAGVESLADDGIILAGWKDSPLPANIGDSIELTYFEPVKSGNLREQTASFKLRGVIPLAGVAADPDLTPEFPGITDKLELRDWDPPFPYFNERVKPNDDKFWQQYRTTPKAYVTQAAGQKLWGSRFGSVTSIRLAPSAQHSGQKPDLSQSAEQFRVRLLNELQPEQGGFVIDQVRERALNASAGGTDFGWLFLGFSFFLIAAALLLVSLLFRLNLDRRASEIGLLLAAGYRRRRVRGLLLAEGGILAAIGGLIGCVVAVLYAGLLLRLLSAWWPGSLERSFLSLHVTWTSLAIGYGAAFLVSLLTIAWSLRALGRVSPVALLAGETTPGDRVHVAGKKPRWSVRVALGTTALAIALLILGNFVRDHEIQALTFFGGGGFLLTAGLTGVWAWMQSGRHRTVNGHGRVALARLGIRNAARHPSRSLLTAGLLASAAFLVVAVESFRRQPDRDYLKPGSGSGGFALLGEADLPIFRDLNSDEGRADLSDSLEIQLRRQFQGDNERTQKALKQATKVLTDVRFFPFRQKAGDDASCLNLYRPGKPRLLGVPPSLIERGGFQFAETAARLAEERENPWRLLDEMLDDGVIPVFGEKNTVVWQLKSGLGKDIEVADFRGEKVRLRLVGLLQDSVFQSQLLMSDSNFLKLHPNQEGYNVFLIDTGQESPGEMKTLLETALADRGFDVTATKDRLAAFLAVENIYLSTFQALGGLGLLLGACGLAVVLLRSVWERRGELALLRALGYRHEAVSWLLLTENGFLLFLGLLIGIGSALLAVAPHLWGTGEPVFWLDLLGFLVVVLVVGLTAETLAVRSSVRTALLPALRRE